MTARRNFIIGGACLAAAGAGYGFRPRKRLVLLKGSLSDALPAKLGDWTAENSDALVQPKTEEGLAATLYSEMVGRIYHQASTGAAVMMLIAYGDTQSDLLQLHRPEACYPAVGFTLVSSQAGGMPLPGGGQIPVRRVVATAPSRQENIVYWARMGEALPTSSGEQRRVRLETAMQGYVPDGVLVRFSMVGENAASSFAVMSRFIPALLEAMPSNKRPALIGTSLSKSMVA